MRPKSGPQSTGSAPGNIPRLDCGTRRMQTKRTLIRYKTKPERTEENEQLIEGVFADLHAKSPEGVRYLALRLGDGTFVHFVAVETKESDSGARRFSGFSDRHKGPVHRAAAIARGRHRRKLSHARRVRLRDGAMKRRKR